jgi:hypothetical protein
MVVSKAVLQLNDAGATRLRRGTIHALVAAARTPAMLKEKPPRDPRIAAAVQL